MLPSPSPPRLRLCLSESVPLCSIYNVVCVCLFVCLSSFASVSHLHQQRLVSSILLLSQDQKEVKQSFQTRSTPWSESIAPNFVFVICELNVEDEDNEDEEEGEDKDKEKEEEEEEK